ncbi:MAG: radical SAM protein [Candidatus Euphemobacter frigidus]|nr:radical SAM protein [Candidatus Euphemobacter frigidus]MDP8276612.1 radical SAM protein [Candidatus Euphemobacter frigidus]
MLIPYFQTILAVLRSNLHRLSRPYKLTLALTYRCNFHCRACLTWQRPPVAEMTIEDIRKFFQRQNYFSWVDLTGGEITLRSDLPEIIEAVTENSRRLVLLHFPTNGFLPERAVRAARAAKRRPGLKFVVTVSLDGPPAVHDRLKGKKGSWERALETFAALRREKGVEAFLGMTLQRENLDLRRETIAAVQKRIPTIRAADFHYNLAHISFFYNNLKLDPTPGPSAAAVFDDLAAGYRLILSPRKFLERSYLKGARGFVASGLCPIPCQSLSSSCFIDPTWNVYPCTGYDRLLGNLRDVDFDLDRIWNSPATVSIRDEIVNGRCPQCWTPCEAYQTILGNLFRRRLPGRAGRSARCFTPEQVQK